MTESEKLFEDAKKYIPGGVNSPVRSFSNVEMNPVYVKKARGSKIYTEDGEELSDFVMSWGAIILGHSHEKVVEELRKQIEEGTSFGLNHRKEVEFAKMISKSFGDGFSFRFVNSGTEAVMSIVRVARGFSKKKFVMRFSGCFHGHSDQFLTSSGSGLATLQIPTSDGVPEEFISCTITLPFNAPDDILEDTFKKYDIACCVLEVLPANMGVIPPKQKFISKIYELCKKHKSLLIYDEIVTGFRVGWGGITKKGEIHIRKFDGSGEKEEKIKVPEPDLITLGKVIGGGTPIGAFGGKKDIMSVVAPSGKVYQSGTFAGNPLSIRAGLATLCAISSREDFYKTLRQKTEQLFYVLKEGFLRKGIPVSIVMETGVISVFFSEKVPENFEDAKKSDTEMFKKFFKKLLENKVLIPPSPFEAWFLSVSHEEEDIERVEKAIESL